MLFNLVVFWWEKFNSSVFITSGFQVPSKSELFWITTITVSEPMWINPNQSEKRFKSHLLKNASKLIWLNPIHSKTSIRMNPNESEVNFPSEWIRINPHSDFFQSERISVRINSDSFRLNIRFRSIRIRIDSDSFGLKIYFRFFRIHSDRSLGLSQINFQAFFNKRDLKHFLDWFGLIRIGSDADIGIIRNSSDWLGRNSYPKFSPETLFRTL